MNTNRCDQNVTVSPAVYGDLEDILALQKIAYQSEAALIDDYNIPPLTQTIDGIEDEFRQISFLKAEMDTRIVGSVRAEVQEETCFIKRLIVYPDFQNCGIGSLLLMTIEQCFPRVERYELFTGKESKGNHLFYTRRGYHPFKEEKIDENLTFVYYEKMNECTGFSAYHS
jgi:GNAT superfamily N-acetyltransferase